MKRDGRALAAALAVLAVPPLVALADAWRIHVLDAENGRIESSGELRSYLLYVPPSRDPTQPAPLVISLHGGAGWPGQQRDVSRWNRLADRHGFMVAYPSGLEGRGPRAWRARSGAAVEKDVRFIVDMVEAVDDIYRVDRRRVYANGLSNGGGMAFALACALPERIAAVGMVAAAHMLPWGWCAGARPVPMMVFHGTADPVVPYSGGRSWVAPRRSFPEIPAWAARAARRNGCSGPGLDERVAPDVTRRTFSDCDADVVLFTVEEGGHTWPGGAPLPGWLTGRTSDGVDATREMWTFFEAHPLPGP